ncbi:19764_t:CDS:2, partial [Gigaspora rosea]
MISSQEFIYDINLEVKWYLSIQFIEKSNLCSMPCYASTIVRIKFVKKYEKEDTNFVRIWAIGGYPIECKDYDIDMTLFVPVDLNARDLETQAVFEKDNFYCVGGKIMTISTSTHLTIHDRASKPELNKCPLKISLIGVPKEMPKE